jgi:hypothetical protein
MSFACSLQRLRLPKEFGELLADGCSPAAALLPAARPDASPARQRPLMSPTLLVVLRVSAIFDPYTAVAWSLGRASLADSKRSGATGFCASDAEREKNEGMQPLM